ncbi:MAG TPA: hypothetical protein VD884_20120 [Ohtaekwangia sp.]|nr:hypothetical protein [Ohtaekwangia sp.]
MKKFIGLALWTLVLQVNAQLPLIDRGVQVEGMWFFPLYGDTSNYVYLPYEAALATTEDNMPQFSYMRYMMNSTKESTSASSIQDADGGAILNFLVLYKTPEEKIANAETTIRKRLKNDSINVRGPIVLDRGRYSLVSSIVAGDSVIQQKQLLSTGNAPVLENTRVALSFGLTPHTSKILTANFKMNTPDISLVFDVEFSGLTEDYDAELEIDWTEVKKHQGFNAGGSVYFVSADVKIAFDELFKNQAIKLTVNGNNPNMEALLNTVYDKLLTVMFQPVEPEQLPAQAQNDLIGALAESLGPNGILGSKNTTGFGLNVGYQLKEMKSSGKSTLRFKGRSTVQRHHFITFNIGNLHRQYGENKTIFRDVAIDGAFQQRAILVGIDGELEKEFEKILNSVTVILNKDHLNGDKTTRNIIITNNFVKDKTKSPSLVYGYHSDTTNWLLYKHRAVWQFRGGASYETEWKEQDASMINLYTPFKRKTIELEGDMQTLIDQGIRALSVQIQYPFFSQTKQERITMRTDEPLREKYFEITQPIDQEEIDFTITYITTSGEKITRTGKDKIGIIFLDEISFGNE